MTTNPTNHPTKRRTALLVTGLVMLTGTLLCQPVASQTVSGQAATLSLIGAYGAQATLNALATQSAYQQQQSAVQAQQAAAAAQAQAAALQAQAYAQAQQATASAQQQQAQIAAAQATADAAALQATAIVQQTRTALELAAQQTRSALQVKATQTAAVLQSQATRAAIDATHTANEAKRRDDEAVATSVAMSIEATRVAIMLQSEADAARLQNDQRLAAIQSITSVIVISGAGALLLLLCFKVFLRAWRSRSLNPVPTVATRIPGPSAAAQTIVDADTGQSITEEARSRIAVIELNDQPELLAELLKVFDDDLRD